MTTDGLQTVATFSCDVGYTINDIEVVTSECDQNGNWASTTVECSEYYTLIEIWVFLSIISYIVDSLEL